MNKIPNNSHQGPAASAASGVNKIGFWPAKDCLLQPGYTVQFFAHTLLKYKLDGRVICFYMRGNNGRHN